MSGKGGMEEEKFRPKKRIKEKGGVATTDEIERFPFSVHRANMLYFCSSTSRPFSPCFLSRALFIHFIIANVLSFLSFFKTRGGTHCYQTTNKRALQLAVCLLCYFRVYAPLPWRLFFYNAR